MSRYGGGWEDDFFAGARAPRRREYGADERYGAPRDDEGRGYARGRDDYDDERTLVRGSAGRGYGRGEYYDDYYARGRGDYDEAAGRGDYYRDDYYPERRPARREREDDERYSRDRRGRRGASRSHVRCRDIMTRDVTVATRETTLEAVARMMRDEDTGVIPVIERAAADLTDLGEKRTDVNRIQPNVAGSGGRLVGLITDRDVVVRAVAEGKDARTTRAEEIMTTDIHTAQPNDRVIEAIRKMGDK
jgi:CBS domain-containing protein